MSDYDNNRGSGKPPRKQPDRFQPKVLIIWMAILLAIFMIYSFSPNQGRQTENITYKQLEEAVDAGLVETGTIKADPNGGPDWTKIVFELKGQLPEDLDQTEELGWVKAGGQYVVETRLTDESLQKLQNTGIFSEVPTSRLLSQVLLTLLPILIIILIVYLLFVRQLRNAGRGAMSFGKSRAKMLTRESDRILFNDVAGCDEAKEEVSEVVEFLKDPKKFQSIGGRIPKGVLLVGPPGTGKTLLAKAVAGEAEVPFFSISGSDFVEMFVGVGAARVRDMFEQGRKNAPCIIFIDEIDAVGRQRGAGLGGGNDEREQTLNSLLVEMDGFDSHEGVIIIAATNRPDVLDNALLRPGRFDRQIYVDLPDLPGRVEILKVHAKKIKLSKEVDLEIVARSTPGFSGADLANLLNEAALLAARHGKKEVDHASIDEARDKISYGRERRKLMDDEDKKITAFHEAGHAIVQAEIDDGRLPVHKVTIIPRGRSLGSTMFVPKKDILNHSKHFSLNRICCAMGGRVAEKIVFDEITSGAAGDIKMATDIARHMVCDWGMSDLGMINYGSTQDHVFIGRELGRSNDYSDSTSRQIDDAIKKIIDDEYQRAKDILTRRRKELDILAETLLKFETVEGKHVQEILDHGEIRSPIDLKPSPKEPTSDDGKKEEEEAKKKAKEEGEELGPGTSPAGVPA